MQKKLIFLIVTLWLTMFLTAIRAEVISEHNEQHVAQDAAQNLLRDKGCRWTDTTRKEGFRLMDEGQAIRILGNELLVVCVSWDQPSQSGDVMVSWEPPTERADGTPLDPDEIDHYLLHGFNGIVYEIPGDRTSATVKTLGPGNYTIRMQAVDTNGVQSAFSNPVELVL